MSNVDFAIASGRQLHHQTGSCLTRSARDGSTQRAADRLLAIATHITSQLLQDIFVLK
jgi:hypothetical protein